MTATRQSDVIWGGVGGAVVTTLIAILYSIVAETRREAHDVAIERTIAESKQEFLKELSSAKESYFDNLQAAFFQAAEMRVQVRSLQKETSSARDQALEDAVFISTQKDAAERIVSTLSENINVEPSQVANILQPDIMMNVKDMMRVLTFQVTDRPQIENQTASTAVPLGAHDLCILSGMTITRHSGTSYCQVVEIGGGEWQLNGYPGANCYATCLEVTTIK